MLVGRLNFLEELNVDGCGSDALVLGEELLSIMNTSGPPVGY